MFLLAPLLQAVWSLRSQQQGADPGKRDGGTSPQSGAAREHHQAPGGSGIFRPKTKNHTDTSSSRSRVPWRRSCRRRVRLPWRKTGRFKGISPLLWNRVQRVNRPDCEKYLSDLFLIWIYLAFGSFYAFLYSVEKAFSAPYFLLAKVLIYHNRIFSWSSFWYAKHLQLPIHFLGTHLLQPSNDFL